MLFSYQKENVLTLMMFTNMLYIYIILNIKHNVGIKCYVINFSGILDRWYNETLES